MKSSSSRGTTFEFAPVNEPSHLKEASSGGGCVYIYGCVYIWCVCARSHICMFTSGVCVCMYVHIYVCLRLLCVCVHIYVFTSGVCMYVCVHIYACLHLVCVHGCTYMHVYIWCVCACTYMRVYVWCVCKESDATYQLNSSLVNIVQTWLTFLFSVYMHNELSLYVSDWLL